MYQRSLSSIKLNKTHFEWLFILIILMLSFLNNIGLFIFLLFLSMFLRQGSIGAMKILNLITLRTVINPAIAVNISNFQMIKWGIIFMASFVLLKDINKIYSLDKGRLKKTLILIYIFGFYNIISSLFISSFPTIAIFKVISYIIPFSALLIGVKANKLNFDLLKWLYYLFLILIVGSIPLIISPIGYLKNGHAFQGITNQPNLLGIFLVLFISIALSLLQRDGGREKLFWIILSFYFIILSKSRTGFISSLLLFAIYIFVVEINLLFKIVLSIKCLLSLFIVNIITKGSFFQPFFTFIYKGQENILYSRSQQAGGLLENFISSPLFGNGFSVPYIPNYRDWSFSMDQIVEPGNLLLAILSFSGIIGLMLFSAYLINIFFENNKQKNKYIFLFVATILITMGEMIFFSTNNIAIWNYSLISIYYAYSD